MSEPSSLPPPFAHPAAAPLPAPSLTAEQWAQVRQASEGYRPLRRAAAVARGSGLTTLILGMMTAAFVALSFDLIGAIAAVVLCVVGAIELFGQRRLLRAEPGAARLLMLNQLALLACIAIYCAVQIATFSVQQVKNQALSPNVRSELAATPEITQMVDGSIDRYAPMLHYGLYSVVLLLSVACQGGMALYYARRQRRLDSFRANTPPWAMQLLHTVAN